MSDPIQANINAICQSGDRLWVGMGDYRIEVLDKNSLEIMHTITENLWEVKCMTLDEEYLYVGSLNEQINIYSLKDYSLVNSLDQQLGVTSLGQNKQLLFSGDYEGNINVWNKSDLELIHKLDSHLSKVNAIELQGDVLISGDGFTRIGAGIHVWDLGTFTKRMRMLQPESKRVNSLRVFGEYLISGHGSPGELRIWNKNFQLIKTLKSPGGDLTNIATTPKFIIASSRAKIIFYNPTTMDPQNTLEEPRINLGSMISVDDKVIYGIQNALVIRDLLNTDSVKTIKL